MNGYSGGQDEYCLPPIIGIMLAPRLVHPPGRKSKSPATPQFGFARLSVSGVEFIAVRRRRWRRPGVRLRKGRDVNSSALLRSTELYEHSQCLQCSNGRAASERYGNLI
jgi:hypothetical protein